MKTIGSLAVVVLITVSLCAGRALADDKEAVGKGAKAWAMAMMEGKPDEMKAHSIGSEEELARWEGMSKMMAAFRKLGDAAKAKYGEDGAIIGRMFRTPDFSQLQAESKIVITGDDATITGKDSKVMKLKKDGGEWKVVLASLNDSGKMDPKQVTAMADAASATADEIKDGKYGTNQEAMMALAKKMAAAGGGGRRPGGAGATPAK
ncbi:MAG: hypothetical protein JWN40_3317 [Phycisphaerales bacterium]|nr:hypothetical protein [Phycisphaerales bacterium]